MPTYQNIPGTKDYVPSRYNENVKTSETYRSLQETFFRLTARYGYGEIITPTMEKAELYVRSVGGSSDIVRKEMYTLQDLGKRELSLRPEGTAGVVRAYVQNKLYATPDEVVKLSYSGSMFRQESPQAGRQREFTQLGAECIGKGTAAVDTEMIAMISSYLDAVGVENVELQINSLGCKECRSAYKEKLLAYLETVKICKECQDRKVKNPLRVLDCKDEACQKETKNAPSILSCLCESCKTDFGTLKTLLDTLGVSYSVNERLVRGLDYYEKTIFEFVETSIGAQSTLCGGGRYNDLVEDLGGPPKGGIGFSIGLERLMIVLENQQKLAKQEQSIDYYLIWSGVEALKKQMQIAQKLRSDGYRVEMSYTERSFKNQFKIANKKQAKKVVIIGEDELTNNVASVKDMTSGEQKQIPIQQI
jgi:histidyl-tRNA synthetase